MSCFSEPVTILPLALGILLARSAAADVVSVRRPDGSTTSRRGKVVDVRADFLMLERIAGRPEKIRTDQVLRIDYDRGEPQQRADAMFESRRYAEAQALYQQALAAESREWVQREIMSRRCTSLRNAGRMIEAAEQFVVLVDADQTLYHLDAAPVVWIAKAPSGAMMRWAAERLGDSRPALRAVAASWLLTSPRRSDAVKVLQQLELESHPRLARWIVFQRQRTAVVRWSDAEVRRFSQRVATLPESLRAGPAYLVAMSYRRLGQKESSIEWALRVALLYPHETTIASESLFVAGEASAAIDRNQDARRIWQLLIERYPGSSAAQRAASRLKSK